MPFPITWKWCVSINRETSNLYYIEIVCFSINRSASCFSWVKVFQLFPFWTKSKMDNWSYFYPLKNTCFLSLKKTKESLEIQRKNCEKRSSRRLRRLTLLFPCFILCIPSNSFVLKQQRKWSKITHHKPIETWRACGP